MLGNIIDLVTNLPKLNYSNKKDFLGEVFEKLLINFAIAEGIGPGQFYTPISVVKTLVAIIKPYKGRVYDLVVVLEDFLFNLKSIMFLLIILIIHGYI